MTSRNVRFFGSIIHNNSMENTTRNTKNFVNELLTLIFSFSFSRLALFVCFFFCFVLRSLSAVGKSKR